MARIDLPTTDELDSTVTELLDQVADIHGFVPNQHRLEAHFPLLLRSLLDLNRRVILAGDLDSELLETIALILAMENECPYCEHYHAMILENRGFTGEEIARLERDWREWEFTDREETIVEFSVAINDDPHSITDEDVAAVLDAGPDEKDLVQLVHFTNLMRAYNTFNVVMDTDLDREEGGWMS